MEVRRGYKQTEVGVIPKDWEIRPLSKLLSENPKYGINAAAVKHDDRLPQYIRITDISADGTYNPVQPVSVNHESSNEYFLEDGDLVFARTGASVGKAYKYNLSDGRLVYAGFLIKIRTNKKALLPEYLFQYTQTDLYWNWVKLMSMRSGQPGINGVEYGQLRFAIPPLHEQKAIASALSDVDALIQNLEKLIAKKRAIKTATMQQLLTGKTRLPGFGKGKGYKQTEIGVIPEDWGVTPLSSFVKKLDAGVSVNSSEIEEKGDESESYILKTSCVFEGVFDSSECKRILPGERSRAKISPTPETIIISRMNTPALVGECGYVGHHYKNLFLPDRLWLANSFNHDAVNVRWLSLLLSFPRFGKKIKETATGTSNSMKNISKPSLLAVKIPSPPVSEQIAIASSLSNIDSETQKNQSHQTRHDARTPDWED